MFGALAVVVTAVGQAPVGSERSALYESELSRKWRSARRALEDAEEHAIVVPAAFDLDDLAAALDDAEVIIDLILDPGQSPSIDPSTAGAIDTTNDPATLAAYATTCVDLALEVEDELDLGAGYDADYVGDRIRTIKHLLVRITPHNYRSIAGL